MPCPPKVSTYTLYASNGKRIRKGTQVKVGGRVIRFMDKLSKSKAISQAHRYRWRVKA